MDKQSLKHNNMQIMVSNKVYNPKILTPEHIKNPVPMFSICRETNSLEPHLYT